MVLARMTNEDWNQLDHFAASEFDEPDAMSTMLMVMLDNARSLAGVPFKITSDKRNGDGSSEHDHGLAVDIDITVNGRGAQRFRIVDALLSAGFSRIGVYYSDAEGHVHAGIGDRFMLDRFPANVMWVGESQ